MWKLTKVDWDVILHQGVWPMSVKEQIKGIIQEYADNQEDLSLDNCANIIYDLVKDYQKRILKQERE